MTRKPRYVKIGNYYTVRPQATPYRLTWLQMALDGAKDAAEVVIGVVVFLGLFLGIPFLIWLVAS